MIVFLFTVSYPANDILRPDAETLTFGGFLVHAGIALATAVVVFAIIIPWALRRESSGAVALALSIIGTVFAFGFWVGFPQALAAGGALSSLIALLCSALGDRLEIGVITNDIYTDEDARFLRSAGVLDPGRIRAVETGACPHTAIRDDVTANLLAIEDLEEDFATLDLVLVESGGDNLTATFSPALVDAQIFVLDVAGGGDVARKGGRGSPGPTSWCSTRPTWRRTSVSTCH